MSPTVKMVFLVALGILVGILVRPGGRQEDGQASNRSIAASTASTRPEEKAANALSQEQQRLAAMTPEQTDAEAKRASEAAVMEAEAHLKRWRAREAWAAARLAGKAQQHLCSPFSLSFSVFQMATQLL